MPSINEQIINLQLGLPPPINLEIGEVLNINNTYGGDSNSEKLTFYSGDASPINLGSVFTGLIKQINLSILVPFTGNLKVELGAIEYEFPGNEQYVYSIRVFQEFTDIQPKLYISGILVNEVGKGYLEIIKGN